jgi:4-hydroxy-2-oxoheptanedioate aldolase
MSEAEGLQGGAGEWGSLRRVAEFKRRLKVGETMIGGWLSLTDPVAAELLARSGFDYLFIDTEHGAWDLIALQTALMGFNGSPTVPIIRVPWNDHVRIKQMLDLGVEGIMAPMVRTVEECSALVRACRYPPVGARGFGPRRASNYYRDLDAYVAAANEAIFVMPQIEDIATLDVIDEFLAVPGIDAVALGPNDLSGTTGHFRQHQHPANVDAVNKVLARAKAAGIPACLGVNSKPADLPGLVAKGVKLLLVTADLELLAAGASEALRKGREAIG